MKDFATRLWTLGVFVAGDVNHISSPCSLLSFLLGLPIGSLLTGGRSKDKVWSKKRLWVALFSSWYFCSFLRNPLVKTGQSHNFSNGAWRESDLLSTRKTSIKWMSFHLWATFLTSAYCSKACLKGFFSSVKLLNTSYGFFLRCYSTASSAQSLFCHSFSPTETISEAFALCAFPAVENFSVFLEVWMQHTN